MHENTIGGTITRSYARQVVEVDIQRYWRRKRKKMMKTEKERRANLRSIDYASQVIYAIVPRRACHHLKLNKKQIHAAS